MTAAIQAAELCYTYPDGTKALDGVSFSIAAGEHVGLVGPSGAGKSTLAMTMVGFVFPHAGKMSINGLDINKKSVAEIREKVGLIFQNPNDQLFMPTLFDDVAFGLLQKGVQGDELEKRVNQALAERGLEGRGSKFPGHLSGGQKRLAALASVLVMQPEVLVLDEPSSNLDPRARRDLIEHLQSIPSTFLLIGHDLEMVLDLCPRVMVLSDSKIVADGDPLEILSNEDLMLGHGLEVPHSLMPHRHEHIAKHHRHATGKKN